MQSSCVSVTGTIASTPVLWVTSRIVAIAIGRVLRTYALDPKASTLHPIASCLGHTNSITSSALLPNMRVATGSEDGTVRIWDVTTGRSLRIFDLAHPVRDIAYIAHEQLMCLTQKMIAHVRLVRDRSKRRHQLVKKLLSNILNSATQIVVSTSASMFAVADGTSIHISDSRGTNAPVTIRGRHVVTALAITEDGTSLATADESGMISLYSNPGKLLCGNRVQISREKATPAQLHWHASAVQALSFAHNDTILLSAGAEAVLVTWRLNPSLFGSRSFLPRLHSAILAVSTSPCEGTYAICQADNAVRFIDQISSTITHSLHGLSTRLLNFSQRNPTGSLSSRIDDSSVQMCSMISDSARPGKVWFAGEGSSVQLLDVWRGAQVDSLQVFSENAVFGAARETNFSPEPERRRVSAVSLSGSGNFMATFDSCQTCTAETIQFGTERKLCALKLWGRSESSKEFTLDTVISHPHGPKFGVSAMAFHPTLPILATSSAEGRSFKLWSNMHSDAEGDGRWRCEAELEYRGLQCNCLSFSSDGSLLAVACEHMLTLWHVDDRRPSIMKGESDNRLTDAVNFGRGKTARGLQVEFLYALIHPPAEEQITAVSYISTPVPLFIALTERGVYLWNTLSQSIWWSCRIRTNPRSLAVDDSCGRFALQVTIPSSAPNIVARQQLQKQKFASCETAKLPRRVQDASTLTAMKESVPAMRFHSASKSSHRNVKTVNDVHAAVTGEQSTSQLCTDGVVAVFDVSSPIPVEIHRLGAGVSVAALSFLPQICSSLQGPSTLACINSKMELSVYTERNLTDEFPLGKDRGQIETEYLPPGGLTEIIGPDKRKWLSPQMISYNGGGKYETTERNRPAENSRIRLPETEKAFDHHLHGPVHIQGPIGLKSFDFIETILTDDRVAYESGAKQRKKLDPALTGDPSHDKMPDSRSSNGFWSEVQETKDGNVGPSDAKAVRSFCVSLIKSVNQKQSAVG